MDSSTIEGRKFNGDDIGDHSLLPPRQRNRGSSMSRNARTIMSSGQDSPPAGGAVPPREPVTQPSAASSSLSDTSFSSNGSLLSQPNIIYHNSQGLPPSTGFMSQPFAIQKGDAMPSLNSFQSFGIPYSMHFPIGAQSASIYQSSPPAFVGNSSDQQRFLMAFADVYRYNLASLQPNIGLPAPSTCSQPPTSTSIHFPDSPRGEISHISRLRSRSPSVSWESSSLSTQKSLPAVIRTPSDPSHIFESEGGSPLSFFVQIDMTNRGSIVNKIKTHGGIIKPNQADADYSILQSKSKIYKPLLEACVTANKLAVSMSFVHDCVEHGVLFNHTPFLLQPLPRRGRGKEKNETAASSQSSKSPALGSYMKTSATSRSLALPKSSSHSRLSARFLSPVPSLSASRLKSQNRPKSPVNPQYVVPSASRLQSRELSEAQEERPDRIKKGGKVTCGDQDEKEKSMKAKDTSCKDKDEKAKHKEKRKPMKVTDTNTKKSNQVTHQSGERSPSPPPVHTRVQRANGKYQYPPVEKEYVLRYVQVLFGRDYEMGITTVAQKMHNKMPHHTFNSWLTTLNSMRKEIDVIRKRAGILYRKNLHSGAQTSDQSRGKTRDDDAEIQRASKRRKMDEFTTDDLASEAQVQDDMKVLANFLMSRQSQVSDDEQDEEAFWALLTSQAGCKTAMSWKEFNQKHHHQILAKCELIAQSGDSLGLSIS